MCKKIKYNLIPLIAYLICIIADEFIAIQKPVDHNTTTYAIGFIFNVIIAMMGGGLIGMVGTMLAERYFSVKGKNVLILGAQGSGKTTLLCHLQRKKIDTSNYQSSTTKTEYEEFVYTKENGEEVSIAAGVDLPGREQAWQHDVKDYIENAEILFYLFDANKFLNDNKYQKDVVSPQLSYINDEWENKNKNLDNVVIIGSHLDKIKLEPDKAITKIKDMTSNKKYHKLLANNFGLADIRDNRQSNKIFQIVLK